MFKRPIAMIFPVLVLVLVAGMPKTAESQTLYALDNGFSTGVSTLGTIDPADGSDVSTIGLVLIGGATTVTASRGMAMDPVSGTMFFIEQPSWQLCSVDLSDGTATVIGSLSGHRVRDLTFDATGQLYGVTGRVGTDPNSLVTIDTSTGASTLKVALSGNNEHGIAFDPSQPNLIWHLAADGATTLLETIDIGTNAITAVTPLSGTLPQCPLGLVWNPLSNVFLFVDCEGGFFLLTQAGAFSDIGMASANNHGLAFDQATTVPVELVSFSVD